MKWIFAILVALNLIVFSAMVAQQMFLPKTRTPQMMETTTTPSPAIPQPPLVSEPKQPQPVMTTIDIKKTKASEASVETPSETSRNEVKAMTKKTTKQDTPLVSKPTEKPDKKPTPKATPPKKTNNAQSASNNHQRCGRAQATLPENDYHRIKGLLNEWQNVASSQVEPNPNGGKEITQVESYNVILLNYKADDAINLVAKGLTKDFPLATDPSTPSSVLIGHFKTKKEAENLQIRAKAAGYQVKIHEKNTVISTEPLSRTMIHVVFLNINDDDAKKLNTILKPYTTLKRDPC